MSNSAMVIMGTCVAISCMSPLAADAPTITGSLPPHPAEMGCGVQALFAATKVLEMSASMQDVITAVGATDENTSLLMLQHGCEGLGLHCEGLAISAGRLAGRLAASDCLFIAAYGSEHFVLVVEATPSADELLVYDFPHSYRIALPQFNSKYVEKALLLSLETCTPFPPESRRVFGIAVDPSSALMFSILVSLGLVLAVILRRRARGKVHDS